MPMMARNVVVLPAPLRPSSVTNSPSATEKSMPWRMWDSPYHAWRSLTRSNSRPFASGMAGAHIGFADLGIIRHRMVVAFGQHPAARQDRDHVRQVGNHRQVVLD